MLVLDRARRVQRELEAMRTDLSMLHGLEAGYARLGVVGTASRWLVPGLVEDLRERAPGVRLRVNEAASERLFAEVIDGELAQAVVTEPVNDRRLVGRSPPRRGAPRARPPRGRRCPPEPVPLAVFAQLPLVLPPEPNPFASRSSLAAEKAGISLRCRSRSRASGSSRTSCSPVATRRSCPRPRSRPSSRRSHGAHRRTPAAAPRHGERARDTQMSLADQAVRDSVRNLVEKHLQTRDRPQKQLRSRTTRDKGVTWPTT